MSSRTWIHRLRDVAGAVAVAGTLALLSPGVVLQARAEDSASSEKSFPDGPSCQAGPSPEQMSLQLDRWVDLVAAAAAQQPSEDGTGVVVLNNRGYNYAPEPIPEGLATELGRPLR